MKEFINLYQPFFDKQNWFELFQSPSDWMLIGTLIIMECLLSVDNAVVLAAQTKVLPTEKERKQALMYGLWGAYLFRFIAIGLGSYLIHLWQIKVLGALYLIYLAYSFFFCSGKENEHEMEKKQIKGINLFWSTVISIELMDVAFSVDAVLASLAVSTNPVVILIGGLIGILCMRGVAQIMAKLMDKIPELEAMAYFLILFIGIKLFLSIPVINIEIPTSIFSMVVFGSLFMTIIVSKIRVSKVINKE